MLGSFFVVIVGV